MHQERLFEKNKTKQNKNISVMDQKILERLISGHDAMFLHVAVNVQ